MNENLKGGGSRWRREDGRIEEMKRMAKTELREIRKRGEGGEKEGVV